MAKSLVYFREDLYEDGKFVIEKTDYTDETIQEFVDSKYNFKEAQESDIELIHIIEAIHAGPTRNNTFYQADKLKGDEELKSGAYSLTYPYNKPMLTHHNTYDGEPVGRIRRASFVQKGQNEKPALVIVANILSKEAAEKVRDGRYLTVSIGGYTDSITCSICGYNIMDNGYCPDHSRGKTYDGQKCYWIMGNIWIDEVSYVNVPADPDAKGISYETAQKEVSDVADKNNKESAASAVDFSATIEEFRNMVAEQFKAFKEELLSIKVEPPKVEETQDETATKLTEAEAKVAFLEEEVNQLKSQVENFTSQLQSKAEENTALVQANADLIARIHKSLAEKVVSMKVILGKVKESDVEQAIVEHVARTEESLNDALTDLVKEAEHTPMSKFAMVGTITNPGGCSAGEQQTETKNNDTGEVIEGSKQGGEPIANEKEKVERIKTMFSMIKRQ